MRIALVVLVGICGCGTPELEEGLYDVTWTTEDTYQWDGYDYDLGKEVVKTSDTSGSLQMNVVKNASDDPLRPYRIGERMEDGSVVEWIPFILSGSQLVMRFESIGACSSKPSDPHYSKLDTTTWSLTPEGDRFSATVEVDFNVHSEDCQQRIFTHEYIGERAGPAVPF